MTIAVICDRCRTTGVSGVGEFSQYGDLLEFEPVPRPVKRVDGWHEEKQRAFIALLATTGSAHRAARALGMTHGGVNRPRQAEGSASFSAAWDRALEIAEQNGTMKISTAVADAAARNAQLAPPSRLRGHQPADDEPVMDEAEQRQLLENLFYKWLGKVEQEREARLAGEVVAADYYLRQTTCVEVIFDLMCSELGEDAWEMIANLRRGGEHVTRIAATPVSEMLDAKRRELWDKMGEPKRPEYPPARYLIPKIDFSLASESQALSEEQKQLPPRDQQQLCKAMHEQEAEAQAEWERRARGWDRP